MPRVFSFLSYLLLLVVMGVALFATFLIAPAERVQGDVYRLLFVHVPSAWLAFLAFGIVAIGSALYLIRRSPRWDRLAVASAEAGVLFTTLALATGSIWGRHVWGVWWQWDPRLTTTLVMWFIYAGYLALRAYIDEPESKRRMSAVAGIVGIFSVPLVWFSVEWWRSLHPTPSVTSPGGGLPRDMLLTLLLCVAAFTVLYGIVVRQRMLLEQASSLASDLTERLHAQQERSE